MRDDHFQLLMRSGEVILRGLIEEAEDEVGESNDYDSPIEHLLACAMVMQARYKFHEFRFTPDTKREHLDLAPTVLCNDLFYHEPCWGLIAPQVLVGQYRVDFMVAYLRGIDGVGYVAIECDGHAFHEKTKKQAARDKARDRDLQNAGVRVLRFTGSEIYRDPIGCADEALQLAYDSASASSNAKRLIKIGRHDAARRELRHVQ